ncbi:MAG: 3-alpha,7-alpha,12-alpha-trihydroxy-5-beta-cholest-24-enoyl-CoA hydratase, partial [Acetobacteraceae bacterium]|nr:3-alpha,7-alpha,12-alpha-trihydroxy-5-beta-cholest-24-enoyl-CoA hydratase [Acetobacteraceae bacterium]
MPIIYEKLLNYPIPEMRQHLRWQDVAMYNFSVGLGQDPMDEQQLDFLYEPRLKVMPSMPVVLGAPGFWSRNPDTGMDWVKIVHGEQGLILHKPLPTEGEIIGRSRVTGLVDRGEGKGALMYSERQVI